MYQLQMTSDTEIFVQSIISAYPTTKDNLAHCSKGRPYLLKLIEFCNSSWPNRNLLKGNIKQVGILISKSQALQILYLKHHVYKTS